MPYEASDRKRDGEAQLLTRMRRNVLSRAGAGVLLQSEHRLAASSILCTNHFKREGAESAAMSWSRLPPSVLTLCRTLPCPALSLGQASPCVGSLPAKNCFQTGRRRGLPFLQCSPATPAPEKGSPVPAQPFYPLFCSKEFSQGSEVL